VLLAELIQRGASVAVYDPAAMEEARRALAIDFCDANDALSRIRFSGGTLDSLQGADALVIVTEWKTFRSPDFNQIRTTLKSPVIFDGRNLFEPRIMAEAGFEYHGIGRSVLARA
jgi:UDPglucose 6-dehydrogenase